VAAEPVQNRRPAVVVPCANTKVWVDGVPPSRLSCTSAPPSAPTEVGLPTIVSGLPSSFATPTTLRFSLAPVGFFTTSVRPRMV